MNDYESYFAAKSRRRMSRALRREILAYLSIFGFIAVFVTLGLMAIDPAVAAAPDFLEWLLNPRRR